MPRRFDLTLEQKRHILDTYTNKLKAEIRLNQSELAEWAFQHLKLARRPSQSVISRLLARGVIASDARIQKNIMRTSRGQHPQLEQG